MFTKPNIRPWYVDDIMRSLASVYFATRPNRSPKNEYDEGKMIGFASAVAAIAIAVGGNPETFLTPADIQRIKTSR